MFLVYLSLLFVLFANEHAANILKRVFLGYLTKVIQYVCLSRRLTDSKPYGDQIYEHGTKIT